MKKKFLLITFVFLALLSFSACGKKKTDPKDDIITNVEDNVANFLDQTVEGVTFKDALIIYENGVSTLTAMVTNETKTTIKMSGIGIKLYDVNDNLIIDIPNSYVSEIIEPGKELQLIQEVTKDISKAVKIEYTIKR